VPIGSCVSSECVFFFKEDNFQASVPHSWCGTPLTWASPSPTWCGDRAAKRAESSGTAFDSQPHLLTVRVGRYRTHSFSSTGILFLFVGGEFERFKDCLLNNSLQCCGTIFITVLFNYCITVSLYVCIALSIFFIFFFAGEAINTVERGNIDLMV
jgi:hypothetical protein